jgi:outer membrane protein assembly factor BamB
MQSNFIVIGIAGNVLALDRTTGQEVWRTKLKGSDFVNVAFVGEDLLAAACGEMFCLDPATGQIRWKNPLKGLGFNLITIAAEGGGQSVVLSQKKRQDDATASAAAAV